MMASRSYLFGVSPLDITTYTATAVIVGLVGPDGRVRTSAQSITSESRRCVARSLIALCLSRVFLNSVLGTPGSTDAGEIIWNNGGTGGCRSFVGLDLH